MHNHQPSPTSRRAAAVFAVGAALTIGAVARAQTSSPTPDAPAGQGDVQKDSSAPVAATTLLPLADRTTPMKIIDGQGKGRDVTLSLKKAGDGMFAIELGDLNTIYVRQDDGGAVEIIRLTLPEEGKGVIFDPPVPLLPAAIEPGMTVGVQSQAKVYDLKTNQVTRTGTAHHNIKSVSTAEFDTPAGAVRGYLVKIEHRINLDMAEVTIELSTGYQPGQGIIYRRMESTVEKMGLFGNTTTRTVAAAGGALDQ